MTTQISDSMTQALTALEAMDRNSILVREVAVRLLSEHAEGLPQLLAVRTMPEPGRARIEFQPHTNQDAAQWAQALGVTLEEYVADVRDGWERVHTRGDVDVDGVTVHVGSCEWVRVAAASDAVEAAA